MSTSIEVSPESTGNILVVTAGGKLTKSDYVQVIIPRLKSIIQKYGKARYLVDGFTGWELPALWQDVWFGLSHRHRFEKIGLIAAPPWLGGRIKLLGALLPNGELKTFSHAERGEAMNWIRAS